MTTFDPYADTISDLIADVPEPTGEQMRVGEMALDDYYNGNKTEDTQECCGHVYRAMKALEPPGGQYRRVMLAVRPFLESAAISAIPGSRDALRELDKAITEQTPRDRVMVAAKVLLQHVESALDGPAPPWLQDCREEIRSAALDYTSTPFTRQFKADCQALSSRIDAQRARDNRFYREVDSADPAPDLQSVRVALEDARGGWRYIRQHHGDLAGVGWDRVEDRLTKAIAAISDSADCIQDRGVEP